MEHPSECEARIRELEAEIAGLRRHPGEASIALLPERFDALVVRVGKRLVAIPVEPILEVVPRVTFTSIPDSPPEIAGSMRWRGEQVIVHDLETELDGGRGDIRVEDRVVVLRHESSEIGVVVDELIGVESFRGDEWTAIGDGEGDARPSIGLSARAGSALLLLSVTALVRRTARLGASAGGAR